MLLNKNRSHLLIVDLQERLLPAISGANLALDNANILLQASAALEIPATISEQYPKGLGGTAADILVNAGHTKILPKESFSCFGAEILAGHLETVGQSRDQLVVCGTESHVCVLQTCMDAVRRGYEVFLVTDACASRTDTSKATAIRRMENSGIHMVTTEMVVFEWLEKADTEIFRQLHKLIK